MRIDGVSRETGPHLFVYINRCYSHYLVIPSMILTRNAFDHYDRSFEWLLITDIFNRVNIPSQLFKLAFPHRHLQFYENCQCEEYHKKYYYHFLSI